MTDPFGTPSGEAIEYLTIKDFVGELVLIDVKGTRTVNLARGPLDVPVTDFIVLTGDRAGEVVENSDVLNEPVNRELRPYVTRDQQFLGRVEAFKTAHSTQSYGFGKPSDEDKTLARNYIESGEL